MSDILVTLASTIGQSFSGLFFGSAELIHFNQNWCRALKSPLPALQTESLNLQQHWTSKSLFRVSVKRQPTVTAGQRIFYPVPFSGHFPYSTGWPADSAMTQRRPYWIWAPPPVRREPSRQVSFNSSSHNCPFTKGGDSQSRSLSFLTASDAGAMLSNINSAYATSNAIQFHSTSCVIWSCNFAASPD